MSFSAVLASFYLIRLNLLMRAMTLHSDFRLFVHFFIFFIFQFLPFHFVTSTTWTIYKNAQRNPVEVSMCCRATRNMVDGSESAAITLRIGIVQPIFHSITVNIQRMLVRRQKHRRDFVKWCVMIMTFIKLFLKWLLIACHKLWPVLIPFNQFFSLRAYLNDYSNEVSVVHFPRN